MRKICLVVCLIATVSAIASYALAANNTTLGKQYHVPLHEHPTLLEMLQINNHHRESNGLHPHRINAELCRAAQNHAEYMAQGGEFSHYANGGYQGRAVKFGYRGGVLENIAWGQQGVRSVFSTWMNSGGHYASIMSDSHDAGFGLAYSADGSPFWVAVYGSPAPKRNSSKP